MVLGSHGLAGHTHTHSLSCCFSHAYAVRYAACTDYYVNVLGATEFSRTGSDDSDHVGVVGFAATQAKLHLIERHGKKGQPIEHAKAFGRVAFAISDITPIYDAVQAAGDKVLHHPVTLPTPGKADVVVVIIQDRDDYEICFVGEEGFNDLSKPVPGADAIDWAARAESGADR